MAPWEEYQAAAAADPTTTPSLKPWEEYAAADTLPQPRDYASEIPSGAELTQMGVEGEKALPVFVRHALEKASHVVPQSWSEVGGLAQSFFPPIDAYRQAKQGYDIATGTPPQEAVPGITALKDLEDIKNQYGGGSPEYQAAAGDVAGDIIPQMVMAALVGKGLDVPRPSHLRTEPLVPEPPPTVPSLRGPTTIAQDVSRALEKRFTMVPEAPPDIAPAPTIEETIAQSIRKAPELPVDTDVTQSLARQIMAQRTLTPDVVRRFAENAEPMPLEIAPEPTGPVSETAVEKAMRTSSPQPLRAATELESPSFTLPDIPGVTKAPIPGPEQPVPVSQERVVPSETAVTPGAAERMVLNRRKAILDRKKELEARAANGEQGLEMQLAAAQADLLDPSNPVVHAPTPVPPEAPGGVPVAETAPEPYTPEAAAARAAQPEPVIPPEEVKYAGGGPQTEVPGTVGISQARTEAELGPGSVVPGTGAEMGSGLAHGRDYINKGGDPRLPIRRANTSGMVGKNDVGIVHAELDRLRVERSKAAAALEANPNDPVLQQNFSVADDAQRAWRKELQPVLTKASDALREAHAASMPDADVGTYQGLADLMDEHFKGERTLSPEERTALAKAARGVKESRNIANGEMAKVEGALEKQVRARGKKAMTPEELEASIRNRLETEFTDCVLGA